MRCDLKLVVMSLLAVSSSANSALSADVWSEVNKVDPSLSSSTASALIKARKLCGVDRVMLAPDGSAFGVWTANNRYAYGNRKLLPTFPDYLRVVSLLEDRANTLRSPLVLDPLGWDSPSNALRVAMAGELIVSIDTSNEELVGFKIEDERFRFARLSSNKLASSDELAEQFRMVANFASPEKSASDRLFIFLGPSPVGLRWKTGVPSTELSDGKTALGNSSHLFALKDPQLLRDDRKLSLVGYGENAHSLDTEVPYLSSIFDRTSGKRPALFSPKAIYDLGNVEQGPSFITGQDEVILDVDLVGSQYAILLQGLDGSQRLLHGDIDHLEEFKTCDPKFALFSTPQRFGEVTTGKFSTEIGNATNSVSYVLRKALSARSSILTVVFHGGPLVSTLAPKLPSDPQTQELPCSDVMTVDGAGSVGGGVHNSLKVSRLGFDAFRHDAETLRELTRTMGYDEIHIIGNSFGGIGAAATTTVHWPELRTISLVAPALQMLPPQQQRQTREGQFSTARVGLQGLKSFGGYVFGNKRGDVNKGMAHFLAAPDKRVHMYLGTEDKDVPMKLLPDDFPSEQLTVVDKATHSSLFRHGIVLGSVTQRICGLE